MTFGRQRFHMAGLLWLLFALGQHASPGHSQTGASGQRPNILFVSLDDLNDWVGVLGGHPGMEIQTPNIDRLARASALFTSAHTPAPACAPARAAILSGVHAARIGAKNVYWGDAPLWRKFDALRNVEMLEQFFKNRGYKTLGGGKIYHAQAPPWNTGSQVEPANWDFYFPSPYITHPHQIRPPQDVIFPKDLDNDTRRAFGGEWWTWGPIQAEDR